MPIISTSLPSDGTTIDAADVNTPFNDILNVVNGNIDSDNVATGGLNYENFGTITGEIPASDMQDSGNIEKFRDEANVAFVASGCIWSALTGLNGAMTAGVVYNANGVRNTPGAVATYAFTASRDTYVDIATNGAVSYSEVTNGAASPALTADYVRIAKVVTSGAAITSITQSASDSLGNLIYNTKPFVDSSSWSSWTPTWTNLTIGNGTQSGGYIQIGKTVFFWYKLVFGTTTSMTTDPRLTPPVAFSSTAYARVTLPFIGNSMYFDASAPNYFPGYVGRAQTDATKMQPWVYVTSGTYANVSGYTTAVPVAFATSDEIFLTGCYEAA